MHALAIEYPSIKVVEVVYAFRYASVVKCDDGKYYPKSGHDFVFLGYTDTCPRVVKYKSYKSLRAAKEYAKSLAEPTYDYYRLKIKDRQPVDADLKSVWYFNEFGILKAVPVKDFLAFDPGEEWKRIVW